MTSPKGAPGESAVRRWSCFAPLPSATRTSAASNGLRGTPTVRQDTVCARWRCFARLDGATWWP
jgi:hypothetical protein